MKKILTTILGLGALTLACQADVIVYKIKATATVTGNGVIQKESVLGWFVINPTNSYVAEVGLFPQLNEFQVFTFSDATTTVVSAKGKNYSVVSWPGNSIGRVLANGVNSPTALITGTATPWLLPKSMVITGNEVYPSLTQFEVDTGVFMYDQATTVSQNGLDGDFNNTVSRLAQILRNEGIAQLPTQSQ